MVAAALAAVIERGVLGVHPVIEVQQAYGLDHASSLAFYAVLGVVGGLVSVAFTDGLLGLRKGFSLLKAIPRWSQPAVGGLVTGVLAVAMMKLFSASGVTGGGYETLGKALAGQLGLGVLLALCAAKIVATVFSYSSGGAGGIFAPSLFVGAMLGGAIGYLDVAALDHEERQLGAFALVGMGAVFAGVVRAPITSVLIIFEMTGGYGLVLPLMLANMTSYVLARRLRPVPIYEALLAQDGIVLPHASPRGHALERLTVGDAMTAAVVSVKMTGTAGEVRTDFSGRTFEMVPALDADGAFQGAIPLAKLRQAAPDTPLRQLVQRVETILADVPLTRAVVRMNDRSVRALVVLDEKTASRVVGILTISDLVRAHARAAGSGQATKTESLALDGLGEVLARDLAKPAPSARENASLEEVIDTLAESTSGAVLVRTGDGRVSGVVLIEHVRDFLGDEQLQRMLVAADLMRPAPLVAAEATLFQLVAQCVASDASALLVAASPSMAEGGVITRSALGAVLVEWYARSSRA